MKEDEAVGDYFSKVMTIVSQRRSYGEQVTDQTVVEKILRSLTPKYDYIVPLIEVSNDLSRLAPVKLMGSLQSHEARINSRAGNQTEKTEEQALQVFQESSRGYSGGQGRGRSRGPNRGRGRGRPSSQLLHNLLPQQLGAHSGDLLIFRSSDFKFPRYVNSISTIDEPNSIRNDSQCGMGSSILWPESRSITYRKRDRTAFGYVRTGSEIVDNLVNVDWNLGRLSLAFTPQPKLTASGPRGPVTTPIAGGGGGGVELPVDLSISGVTAGEKLKFDFE
ncbi:hypothetical protein E3N88_14349 [Mikania micrantha]|uniref:Uncharacterized protein n=1 Tax=Mikania micrantha TaxID=192012 RepID=A0A5N6P189_9ASTR|nr:hypothetical protein E3N88_14349 [Mikania micrantha]